MPASFTISKTGLSTTETRAWDDAMVDRIIAWAQDTFRNADGTQPGPNAALNRAMRSQQQAIRDSVRKWEHSQLQPADFPMS